MAENQSTQLQGLYQKALNREFLTVEEGVFLYHHAPLTDLMFIGDELRKQQVPHGRVTWQIDRNVNTTNVCIANCKFCNFYRIPGHAEAYITDMPTYRKKIEETLKYGGDQLLLQGGHHPELGLDFYTTLFRQLKQEYPNLKLHSLGPPEVAHITKLEKSTHKEVLTALKEAGLDSLPGAGAEILIDRVRRLISKGKCGAQEWLDIMHEAHKLDITTSATMMFGHVETLEERVEHLERLRSLQDETRGFKAYICWTFQPDHTDMSHVPPAGSFEYLRTQAISRLYLDNIPNIQSSWVTQGLKMGQLALLYGANDMGSLMIEENVVAEAGTVHYLTLDQIRGAISELGYTPRQRDVFYNLVDPELEQRAIEANRHRDPRAPKLVTL